MTHWWRCPAIPDRVDMTQRPMEANERLEPGHREIDGVEGKQACIYTMVERYSRLTLAVLVPTKRSEIVVKAIEDSLLDVAHTWLKSATRDNGSEFALYTRWKEILGLKVYCATPGSPWQCGTNENTNGRLQRCFPKGMNFSTLTQHDADYAVNVLNNTPRKCLNWKTPLEISHERTRPKEVRLT